MNNNSWNNNNIKKKINKINNMKRRRNNEIILNNLMVEWPLYIIFLFYMVQSQHLFLPNSGSLSRPTLLCVVAIIASATLCYFCGTSSGFMALAACMLDDTASTQFITTKT